MGKYGGLIKYSRVSIKARKVQSRTNNANNFIDETGQRFGRLTVIRENGRYNNEACWDCLCDCGQIVKEVRGAYLRRKETQSCGCLKTEQIKLRNLSRRNPDKEHIKEIILSLRDKGMSFNSIALKLTEDKIPTLNGGRWHGATVRWIIS